MIGKSSLLLFSPAHFWLSVAIHLWLQLEFELLIFKFVHIFIDENIIERLLDFGYPREAVVQCLNKNELNNATTAYWLIQMAQ